MYTVAMAQIVIRVDPETGDALSHLVELTGKNRSQAARDAIRAAERQAVLERVRRQAEAIRDDPADRAEAAQVARDMEALRAW
jgi:predicted transcriptional regulator